ncbi:uncharacterized protein [Pyrus communis]|uniref:uncharacterized protein n=1 Tax=Pyrus communis TaxID=23211 RepID=UPI0035C066C2
MMHVNLMNNYFNPKSVYTENDFRSRFRMRRHGFKRLLRDVQQVYKDEYLREPNQEGLNQLIRKAEDRGFPSMIWSLDCIHWDWKNCPTGWQRGFSGRSRKPTVVLEAVASYDTWIWHAFFGVPGSQNDIIVLGHAPFFNRLTEGKAP